jgi:chromosome segregation ATPase
VRLFSPPSSNNDASQAPDPQISFADYSKCLAERDIAFAERDSAITRMDEISAESARECEAARKEVVSAKAKWHEVTIERDLAAQERDFLEAENIRHLNMISRLESEILLLRNEVANLKEKQRTTEELLPVYVERQSRLTERVSALELQQRKDQSKSYVFVGSKKSPLLYLKNFTKKLYPELDHKAQLVSLFEEMYAKKKSFRTYVKRRVKGDIILSLRMDVCRDIKKHFAPWKFLEVLDNSKQSLNQVSNCFFLLYFIVHTLED